MKKRSIILQPDEEVIIYIQPEGCPYAKRVAVAQVQLKANAGRATVFTSVSFDTYH